MFPWDLTLRHHVTLCSTRPRFKTAPARKQMIDTIWDFHILRRPSFTTGRSSSKASMGLVNPVIVPFVLLMLTASAHLRQNSKSVITSRYENSPKNLCFPLVLWRSNAVVLWHRGRRLLSDLLRATGKSLLLLTISIAVIPIILVWYVTVRLSTNIRSTLVSMMVVVAVNLIGCTCSMENWKKGVSLLLSCGWMSFPSMHSNPSTGVK